MINKIKYLSLKLWLLALSSAGLLSIPFLVPGTGWISLAAFVPLLAAEYLASESGKKHFWVVYFTSFLLWNLATTYWIQHATVPGAVAAIVLNALQMAVIFRLFRWMRSLSGGFLPYLFLTVSWLAWEHVYYNWTVSWPWLVLGNAFASSVRSIQWYEATGVLGGSFWILLSNALLFRLLQLVSSGKERVRASVIGLLLVWAVPWLCSLILFYRYEEVRYEPYAAFREKETAGVRQFALLQPNIDPYGDKFGGMSRQRQDRLLLRLADTALARIAPVPGFPAVSGYGGDTGEVLLPACFLLGPETFVSPVYWNEQLDEDRPYENATFRYLSDWLGRRNDPGNVNLIVGAVTRRIYGTESGSGGERKPLPPTPTAREMPSGEGWYDRFNAALFMGSDGRYGFYHKSKLVVVVESTPYPRLSKWIGRTISIDLGGSMGHFGTQEERTVFTTPDSVKIGIAVCYEGIYGDFYRDYVKNGAQAMAVISNDGWWGNTPGYRQLLYYSALRCIETRRAMARCANTGISAFIDQRGIITGRSDWWTEEVLTGTLALNDRQTIFVRYGDIIGRVSVFLFWLFLLMGAVRHIGRKSMTCR